MKKIIVLLCAAVLGAACLLPPLPELPVLGEIELPVAGEKEGVWNSTDYNGKPVLLMVMGSWCPYCKMTMPALKVIAEEYGDKVEVVGIFVDTDAEMVKATAIDHGMGDVKALYNGMEVAQILGAEGFPHAVLFDKKHRLVQTWSGFSPERADDFRKALKAIGVK